MLSQLVDKSLVVVDEDDAGVRYRLLESIRQYAQERLEAAGDAAEVRRRHADHYVAVAEAAGPRLRRGDQIAAAAEAARDTDNFRAALDWAAETPAPDHALRLVAALAVNGMTIGYAAMDWADTAVDIRGRARASVVPARCLLGHHGRHVRRRPGARRDPRRESWKPPKPRSAAGNPPRAKDPQSWGSSAAISTPRHATRRSGSSGPGRPTTPTSSATR